MIAPQWMHSQVTADEYESWSEEQCAGIEIVDGMVVLSTSASKRHNRLARVLTNALDAAAGPEWTADTDFDRVVKLNQYASAGIPFYWRVELTPTHIPVVYTYLLDSASRRYRDGDVFTGLVKATVPFRSRPTCPPPRNQPGPARCSTPVAPDDHPT
jgi:hypothetical protein